MSATDIIFYILALVITGGAILAVTSRKIFRAAVFLLFSMMGIAGMYFYLENEFLGAVQIVVYVGGIIVLIIFSIFLTSDSNAEMKYPSKLRGMAAVLAVLFSTVFTLLQLKYFYPVKVESPAIETSVKQLGLQMLDLNKHGYILPFEAVSILLLAAMIGCIVIALKTRAKTQ
jgi:NADH-quinone oxidoreductase subunit J